MVGLAAAEEEGEAMEAGALKVVVVMAAMEAAAMEEVVVVAMVVEEEVTEEAVVAMEGDKSESGHIIDRYK